MIEALWRMYQAWKFNNAMSGPVGGNVCVSCNSMDLDEFAPRVYRCLACGYEGGPGHAEYMAQRKQEKLNALDEPAKQKRAKKLLADARLMLISAEGTLQSAEASGRLDLVGIGGSAYAGTQGEGFEKQQEFVSAVGDILQAQAMMEEAAGLKGIAYPPHLRFRQSLGFGEATVDRLMDNMFSDIAFLQKAARSGQTVKAMLIWCETHR